MIFDKDNSVYEVYMPTASQVFDPVLSQRFLKKHSGGGIIPENVATLASDSEGSLFE